MGAMVGDPREWDAIYWRALVLASPDVILVIDVTGTILFVNQPVPAFPGGDITGQKLWEFAVGEGRARITTKLDEVIRTRKAVVYENPGIRADGSPGAYEVRVIPVLVAGEVVRVLWASTDVTDRVLLEEQLRQSQKIEAIGQLAGGVAHDFNNILGVIMGFGDLAARRLPAGHPAQEELGEVLDAARRGSELTRKLLAFSRKQIMQPRLLDLGATIAEFGRVMRRILGADVELLLDIEAPTLRVQADPVQLEQVLLNLWTNSRQAMPGGGRLRVSVHSADVDAPFVARNPWAKPGVFAEIRVADSGVGMDEATLARVFEPFFTTKEEGTGLGLATVYGIVQQHGGFVRVVSVPGAGTTVHVFLPRASAEDEAASVARASLQPEALRGDETILVAENEPSLRKLAYTALTSLGYRVRVAKDGEEAVSLFERHRRDVALVVLDAVLPRVDAREAYERIRNLRPDVSFLFTTGYAPSSPRLVALLASGEVPILEKPFTPMALAASVRRAIDTRRG